MPARIEPCLALRRPKPPTGPDWVYEIKWDGYRLHLHIEPQRVRILTRRGHDWTHRFPAIEEAARQLGVATAIIDGEAVVLDEQGRPDFGLLQNSLGGRGGKRTSHEASFMAFDLLYFDGHDLRNMDLMARRHLLESLVPAGDEGLIRLSAEFEEDGDRLLATACQHGLEGIIAKNRHSTYHSGRLGDWVKVKCIRSDSFVIIGYERSAVASGGIGRLLAAARKGRKLVYVGGVGTGSNERTADALREELDSLITTKPAAATVRKNAIFVKPKLIAEIEYRSGIHEGMLRYAHYRCCERSRTKQRFIRSSEKL